MCNSAVDEWGGKKNFAFLQAKSLHFLPIYVILYLSDAQPGSMKKDGI